MTKLFKALSLVALAFLASTGCSLKRGTGALQFEGESKGRGASENSVVEPEPIVGVRTFDVLLAQMTDGLGIRPSSDFGAGPTRIPTGNTANLRTVRFIYDQVNAALPQKPNEVPPPSGIVAQMKLAEAACAAALDREAALQPADTNRLIYPNINLAVAPSGQALDTVINRVSKTFMGKEANAAQRQAIIEAVDGVRTAAAANTPPAGVIRQQWITPCILAAMAIEI